jgi:hypothetical protein
LKRIFWAYGVTVIFDLLWAAIKLEILRFEYSWKENGTTKARDVAGAETTFPGSPIALLRLPSFGR